PAPSRRVARAGDLGHDVARGARRPVLQPAAPSLVARRPLPFARRPLPAVRLRALPRAPTLPHHAHPWRHPPPPLTTRNDGPLGAGGLGFCAASGQITIGPANGSPTHRRRQVSHGICT